MKSLVLSHQAASQFSENCLSFQNQDALLEHLHTSFEFTSRISNKKYQQFYLSIDTLHIVLDIEIRPTMLLVSEVHILGERC